MTLSELYTKWAELDTRTKAFAIGTAVLVVVSIFLSVNNLREPNAPEAEAPEREQAITVEEGVSIAHDAEPIEVASEETRMVTSLMDIITKEECLWQAADDELCWMEFTHDGFTEYDGDLVRSATVEFYSIEAIENGRQGTWRVTYDDGSIMDASFTFIQNSETGMYVMSSKAFPTYEYYQTHAISSGNVMAL